MHVNFISKNSYFCDTNKEKFNRKMCFVKRQNFPQENNVIINYLFIFFYLLCMNIVYKKITIQVKHFCNLFLLIMQHKTIIFCLSPSIFLSIFPFSTIYLSTFLSLSIITSLICVKIIFVPCQTSPYPFPLVRIIIIIQG